MDDIAVPRVGIVGGTSGIGFAIAKAVQEKGWTPIIGGRDEIKRTIALGMLSSHPAEAYFVNAQDSSSCRKFFDAAQRLDHLVVSIAERESDPRLFSERNIDFDRAHFDQTFWPAYQLTQLFVRNSDLRSDRSVLFISGGLSRRPLVGKSVFTAAQWAIEGLMRALIKEIAPMRANVLVAGLVRSERWENMGEASKAEMFEQASRDTPVGFIPDPAPIAQSAMEILSNNYINGASIVVDGGWTSAG